jgi:hypothetical protein
MRSLQSISLLSRCSVPIVVGAGFLAGGCAQSHTFVLRQAAVQTRLMTFV